MSYDDPNINKKQLHLLPYVLSIAVAFLVLSACTPAPAAAPTIASSPTAVPVTSTPRIRLLPTWTPSPTPPLKPSPTSQPTATLRVTSAIKPSAPPIFTTGLLIDRPTASILARPASLVSMQYSFSDWSLATSYPTAFMGYSLTSRSNYNCKLEPSPNQPLEGYQVEHFSRPLGSVSFAIDRASQAGVLMFTNYCTGEGEDATCYRMTPGDDHAACTQASESVLATYKLVPNPFMDQVLSSPNHWLCQDELGQNDHCTISYSIPLNVLEYTGPGEGWAAGDDGVIYRLVNKAWSEFSSPATHSIYDLSFSSPTDGWAVGAGAQVLHWDGSAWAEVLPYHGPGEGPGGSTQTLYSVDAFKPDDVWMVGLMKALDGKNYPYAIHWNGKDLIEVSDFPDCSCGLKSVLVLGASDVLAVGGSSLGAISLHWDGTTWTSTLIQGADILYALRQAPDQSILTAGIEIARDQSDTRGALFRWDGSAWQRIALPPLTGGIYQFYVLPSGQIVLGGDFTALWSGTGWQSIMAGLAGYGWITDIEADASGTVWALTRSGNLFKLEISP